MARRADSRALTALFAAEVVSTTGSEMAAIALPWFVLVTTGSPARMGVVMAAEFVGMTIFGVPSGRPATALGPRRTMLAGDAVRAPLIAVIPLLYWYGELSFAAVLVVALVIGAFFPAYSSSQQLVLAGLTGEDEVRLTRLGGVFGSVNETASFVGPAIGGILVVLIGAPWVLVVDGLSYLVAFVLVLAFVPRLPLVDDDDEAGRGALEGLRRMWRDHPLRRRVAGCAVAEIGWAAMIAALPVAALDRYGRGAGLAGWFLACYGAGSVAGGLLATRAKSAADRAANLAFAGMAVATWPLVVPLPAWAVMAAVAANGLCSGLFFPRFFAAVTLRTPPALRARVMTSTMTAISATGPVGFVLSGLLLSHATSVTPAFVVVAAAFTAGSVFVLLPGGTWRVEAPAADATTMTETSPDPAT
ncbi:MAG TPA: MFS transporter [Actinomycetota bacterium]|jgi:MFS family permease